MPIYELTQESIRPLVETTFAAARVSEREDLQRVLRERIEVISPDTLVVGEEFGEWEESRRRIDLLAVDRDANLVVIELKRTEDGGHMELQALRYAAMVSTMTFERVVEVYGDYLRRLHDDSDPREGLLEFLGWDEPDEDRFAQDVRIVLASAEFSKELTTAVMWLNDRDIDIRCVRIRPYSDDDRLLLDVQQVIPLPEAADYQIRIREKERRERKDRAERYAIRRQFWEGLLARAAKRTDLHGRISPSDQHFIATGAGVSGLSFNYVILQNTGTVELYIDRGRNGEAQNKAIFDAMMAEKAKIEAVFGEPLEWQRLDGKRACRIRKQITLGGYRDEEAQWPAIQDAMVDAMIRLEKALRPHINDVSTRHRGNGSPEESL